MIEGSAARRAERVLEHPPGRFDARLDDRARRGSEPARED